MRISASLLLAALCVPVAFAPIARGQDDGAPFVRCTKCKNIGAKPCPEHEEKDCDDGDVCTDDSCDIGLGCQNTNNTAPCEDGDACTTGDTCDGSACLAGAAVGLLGVTTTLVLNDIVKWPL